jgi:antitoxin YefM
MGGMKHIAAEQAPRDIERVIEEVAAADEPIGSGADRNGISETLYLLSIPGMRESILESEAEPLDSCSEALDW